MSVRKCAFCKKKHNGFTIELAPNVGTVGSDNLYYVDPFPCQPEGVRIVCGACLPITQPINNNCIKQGCRACDKRIDGREDRRRWIMR